MEYLASQTNLSAILDQHGSPMGQVIELDNMRLNRAGQRFVRALYFSEVGTLLPVDARVRVGAKMDLRPKDADTITIARVLKTLPDWRNGSVGTAFSYVAAIGPEFSFWFMLLYPALWRLAHPMFKIASQPILTLGVRPRIEF